MLQSGRGNRVPESYSESALRHSADADRLAAASQLDGAGYLVGYVVECAIKSAIRATRPTAKAPHFHLPDLVERAKKVLQGRRQSAMASVLKGATFMQGWKVELRYAGDGTVAAAQFQQWRQDANRALAAANLRRQS
jgi:hypothetical protein